MDEKPRRDEPDLAAALRTARIENAERAEALADLREIELGRLAVSKARSRKWCVRRRRTSTCST